MTAPDYADLRRLLAEATPGPWRRVEGDLEGGTLDDYIATLLANRRDDRTTWITDEHDEKVLLRTLCRECSTDEVVGAIEDREWQEGWHDSAEVEWPCDTRAALADGAGQ